MKTIVVLTYFILMVALSYVFYVGVQRIKMDDHEMVSFNSRKPVSYYELVKEHNVPPANINNSMKYYNVFSITRTYVPTKLGWDVVNDTLKSEVLGFTE